MARPTNDPKTDRMAIRLPPRMVEAVDEWRRHQPDIPARAEAIRRLIARGLEHETILHLAAELWEVLNEVKASGVPLSSEHTERIENAEAAYASVLVRNMFPNGEDESDEPSAYSCASHS